MPRTLQGADLDRDGRTDLVVMHGGFSRVGVYLQQPHGLAAERLFQAPYGRNGPQALALGDANGDGLSDIVVEGEWLRQLPAVAGPMASRRNRATAALTSSLSRRR